MDDKLEIYKALKVLEGTLHRRVDSVLNGVLRNVKESLNGVVKSISSCSEGFENSISNDIEEMLKFLELEDFDTDSNANKNGLEINSMVKIDYIPAKTLQEEVLNHKFQTSHQPAPLYKPSNNYLPSKEIRNGKTSQKFKSEEDQYFLDPLGEETKDDECNQTIGYQEHGSMSNMDPLSCPECNYLATNQKRLKKHIRRTHGKNLHCRYCDYAPKDRITLLHHVRARHEKIKDFKCTECKFAAGFSYSLSRHMKRFHPTTTAQ